MVLRTETEHPEAVEAGTVKIVGADKDTSYSEAYRLLTDEDAYLAMAHAVNPYGHAAKRIVQHLLALKN